MSDDKTVKLERCSPYEKPFTIRATWPSRSEVVYLTDDSAKKEFPTAYKHLIGAKEELTKAEKQAKDFLEGPHGGRLLRRAVGDFLKGKEGRQILREAMKRMLVRPETRYDNQRLKTRDASAKLPPNTRK